MGRVGRARRYRVDFEGKRRLVRRFRGVDGFDVRFTSSCSGCLDCGEAGENLHNYPIDPKSGVHLGNGCSECGYTGKRRRCEWVPFDMDEAETRLREATHAR